jgi:Leu/Phe-tRNA-protein transferase
MKKQTAVDWLAEFLKDRYSLINSEAIFQHAKQMEKQQIMDAYEDGCCYWDSEKSSEQYYNQAFNSEK